MTVEQLSAILSKMPKEADVLMHVKFENHERLIPVNNIRNLGSTIFLGQENIESSQYTYPTRTIEVSNEKT